MASKRIGRSTVKLENPPFIIGYSSIVGPKEGKGPLGESFDNILDDEKWGEESWEKAEAKIIKEAVLVAIKKANKSIRDIDYIFSGDLLNQSTSSTFGVRDTEVPIFGLFGACSTCAEGLSLASMTIDGGFADTVISTTSSHFCSAERQFRFPLEQGGQRPLTSQWTVTGGGAFVLSNAGTGPCITHITTGKIIDMGIKDANNMGAAMAPAAADTIMAHFDDTGLIPTDYDLIVTGDLGQVGKRILLELLDNSDCNIRKVYDDCGVMIFSSKQDTHSGGSGCGCSAAVLGGHIMKGLINGTYKKILFIGTGALFSTTSFQQGESIPCIAHAVAIENRM